MENRQYEGPSTVWKVRKRYMQYWRHNDVTSSGTIFGTWSIYRKKPQIVDEKNENFQYLCLLLTDSKKNTIHETAISVAINEQKFYNILSGNDVIMTSKQRKNGHFLIFAPFWPGQ